MVTDFRNNHSYRYLESMVREFCRHCKKIGTCDRQQFNIMDRFFKEFIETYNSYSLETLDFASLRNMHKELECIIEVASAGTCDRDKSVRIVNEPCAGCPHKDRCNNKISQAMLNAAENALIQVLDPYDNITVTLHCAGRGDDE